MKSSTLNIMKRVPYVSLVVSAVALLIHFYHPLRPHLLYTRTALADGDFWRLASCHWVHLNTDHLFWSTLTFLVLGSFCEIMDRGKFVIAIGISSILIPSTIWIVMPQLEVYGGLSGLDCALYCLLIVLFIQRDWRTHHWIWIIFYIIMLVLLSAKIIYEMTSGLTFFVNNIHTNMVPVPLAHLAGGVVGFAVGMNTVRRIFCRFTPTMQKPEGFRVKAPEGEVVVLYLEPSATQNLKSSGFPKG